MDELQRIKDLAKETYEYAVSDEMERRRRLWTDHNSLIFTRPPIYIRAIPFGEYPESKELYCTDPYLRALESQFLLNRYRMRIAKDDTIIEPWITVQADVKQNPLGVYGLPAELEEKTGGAICARFNPVLLEEDDIKKLSVLPYEVDEEETAKRYARAYDAVGGILGIAVDRQAPLCRMWNNDISTAIAKLRGLEQIMWDAYDDPDWIKGLAEWMRDRILEHIDQTEAAEGFRLNNHQNQAMPYCRELEPPSASDKPVKAKQLWGYMAAQEYTTFGPKMFEEFMFRYQKPIIERYGLSAYGCCEDVTQKIDIIKTIKNLRRIGVSPFSDPIKCAERIGGDYILSYRPNPSAACSRGVDESFVVNELNRVADAFDANGCKWDITLKDLETTTGDPQSIITWTGIVRDFLDKRYGA